MCQFISIKAEIEKSIARLSGIRYLITFIALYSIMYHEISKPWGLYEGIRRSVRLIVWWLPTGNNEKKKNFKRLSQKLKRIHLPCSKVARDTNQTMKHCNSRYWCLNPRTSITESVFIIACFWCSRIFSEDNPHSWDKTVLTLLSQTNIGSEAEGAYYRHVSVLSPSGRFREAANEVVERMNNPCTAMET